MNPPEPGFLSVHNILAIHEDQIRLYGGTDGLRDAALLESAAAQPCVGLSDGYLHEDLYAMAAAYLYHLICNHPFIDGNKRIGAMAAYVFLLENGLDLELDEQQFEDLCMGVAEGRIGKKEAAEFFRNSPKASQ